MLIFTCLYKWEKIYTTDAKLVSVVCCFPTSMTAYADCADKPERDITSVRFATHNEQNGLIMFYGHFCAYGRLNEVKSKQPSDMPMMRFEHGW